MTNLEALNSKRNPEEVSMFSLRDRGRASTGWIEFELVELLEASVILELGLLGGRGKSTKIRQTQLFTLGV
uniref:Uncharacterized protein n=1 Tax=Medicago truncatula TaxID=3880 RepID=I3T3W8_MEDTR|nr:unknown [Medicago truncatula]